MGRTQASAHYDHVGPSTGVTDNLGNTVDLVAHRQLQGCLDPDLGQLLSYASAVGVDHGPREQLAAHADDLSLHCLSAGPGCRVSSRRLSNP